MIFDPEGEFLPGIGRGNVVKTAEEKALWANMGFIAMAKLRSADAFAKRGALQPIEIPDDEIQIMKYYRLGRVVVIAHRLIAGKHCYHTETFSLSPDVIGGLVATKTWESVH